MKVLARSGEVKPQVALSTKVIVYTNMVFSGTQVVVELCNAFAAR